jgi:putative ABC transport system permease protein
MMMLMAAMAIANTILMAAHERTREIGTLRAMGMSKNGVLGLFLAEGSLLGLVAGSVGAAGGTALTWYLSRNPIDLNAMEGQAETIGNDVAYSAFIYVAFSVSIVMMPLLISILVALLASVYPARLASNMEPADAVRAE